MAEPLELEYESPAIETVAGPKTAARKTATREILGPERNKSLKKVILRSR